MSGHYWPVSHWGQMRRRMRKSAINLVLGLQIYYFLWLIGQGRYYLVELCNSKDLLRHGMGNKIGNSVIWCICIVDKKLVSQCSDWFPVTSSTCFPQFCISPDLLWWKLSDFAAWWRRRCFADCCKRSACKAANEKEGWTQISPLCLNSPLPPPPLLPGHLFRIGVTSINSKTARWRDESSNHLNI